MEDQLKPCPFCGSIHIRILPQSYGYSVNCENCDVRKMVFTKYKSQAYAAWNNRVKEK